VIAPLVMLISIVLHLVLLLPIKMINHAPMDIYVLLDQLQQRVQIHVLLITGVWQESRLLAMLVHTQLLVVSLRKLSVLIVHQEKSAHQIQ